VSTSRGSSSRFTDPQGRGLCQGPRSPQSIKNVKRISGPKGVPRPTRSIHRGSPRGAPMISGGADPRWCGGPASGVGPLGLRVGPEAQTTTSIVQAGYQGAAPQLGAAFYPLCAAKITLTGSQFAGAGHGPGPLPPRMRIRHLLQNRRAEGTVRRCQFQSTSAESCVDGAGASSADQRHEPVESGENSRPDVVRGAGRAGSGVKWGRVQVFSVVSSSGFQAKAAVSSSSLGKAARSSAGRVA
jgi:hypothetical protein